MSVTAKQVIDKIREAATNQPRKVYERPSYDEVPHGGDCLYVHENNEAGCIVGKACIDLGARAESLIAFDRGDGTNGSRVVSQLFGLGYLGMTEEQKSWIDTVQRLQDRGQEWASAVATADDEYGVQ